MADGKEVIVQDQGVALSPAEVVESATAQARLLMNIVNQTKCYQEISGKKYLQVEAWETIGAFNRTHAETKEITPIIKEDEIIGYAAHVQLWKDGVIVGGAIMPCYFTENCCKGKTGEAKHKACMSAAQTFATSKAYRMNFSYVAILAGFQATPAEEITEDFGSEQTEHYCPIHQTQFFKRGKMTNYAHPIKDENGEDTGEWCNEIKEKAPEPKLEPQLPASSEAKTPVPAKTSGTIDEAWENMGKESPSGKKIQNVTELKGLMAKHKVGTREAYEILSIGSFIDLVDLDKAWTDIKKAKGIEP
jgi:hypothetical protein